MSDSDKHFLRLLIESFYSYCWYVFIWIRLGNHDIGINILFSEFQLYREFVLPKYI